MYRSSIGNIQGHLVRYPSLKIKLKDAFVSLQLIPTSGFSKSFIGGKLYSYANCDGSLFSGYALIPHHAGNGSSIVEMGLSAVYDWSFFFLFFFFFDLGWSDSIPKS